MEFIVKKLQQNLKTPNINHEIQVWEIWFHLLTYLLTHFCLTGILATSGMLFLSCFCFCFVFFILIFSPFQLLTIVCCLTLSAKTDKKKQNNIFKTKYVSPPCLTFNLFQLRSSSRPDYTRAAGRSLDRLPPSSPFPLYFLWSSVSVTTGKSE